MRLVTTNDFADWANIRTFPDWAAGHRAGLRHSIRADPADC